MFYLTQAERTGDLAALDGAARVRSAGNLMAANRRHRELVHKAEEVRGQEVAVNTAPPPPPPPPSCLTLRHVFA